MHNLQELEKIHLNKVNRIFLEESDAKKNLRDLLGIQVDLLGHKCSVEKTKFYKIGKRTQYENSVVCSLKLNQNDSIKLILQRKKFPTNTYGTSFLMEVIN